MKKYLPVGFFLIVLIALAGAIWFRSSKVTPQTPPPSPSTTGAYNPISRYSRGVTAEIYPQTLTAGRDPSFEVALDTHTVDLSFDIAGVAALTDDLGNRYAGGVWEGSPPGGHHRRGRLTFHPPLSSLAKKVSLTLGPAENLPVNVFSWKITDGAF